jgi:hypothetical protein
LATEFCFYGWKVWSQRGIITTKEEGSKNAYQSYATNDSSNSGDEVEIAIDLFNIIGIFQVIFASTPTTSTSIFEPSTRFYVEILHILATPTNH